MVPFPGWFTVYLSSLTRSSRQGSWFWVDSQREMDGIGPLDGIISDPAVKLLTATEFPECEIIVCRAGRMAYLPA